MSKQDCIFVKQNGIPYELKLSSPEKSNIIVSGSKYMLYMEIVTKWLLESIFSPFLLINNYEKTFQRSWSEGSMKRKSNMKMKIPDYWKQKMVQDCRKTKHDPGYELFKICFPLHWSSFRNVWAFYKSDPVYCVTNVYFWAAVCTTSCYMLVSSIIPRYSPSTW